MLPQVEHFSLCRKSSGNTKRRSVKKMSDVNKSESNKISMNFPNKNDKTLLLELQEANETLSDLNEQLTVQLQALQKKLTESESHNQSVKPLLATIRDQQSEITSLNSSLSEMRKQNENLLELAKSEKKLKEENASLQINLNQRNLELEQFKEQLRQTNQYIAVQAEQKQQALQQKNRYISDLEESLAQRSKQLQKINVDLADSFSNVSDKIANFNEVVVSVKKTIYSNWILIGLFSLIVAFSFIKLTSIDKNVQTVSKTVSSTYSAVTKGLYDPNGVSVLKGTQSAIEWATKK